MCIPFWFYVWSRQPREVVTFLKKQNRTSPHRDDDWVFQQRSWCNSLRYGRFEFWKAFRFSQRWRNIWHESYAIEFGSWHWPDAFGPRQLIRRLTVHSKLIFAWQAHPASSFLVAMKTIKGTNLWQIHRGLQSCWIQYWRLCLPTGLPNESNSVLERQSKSNFKNPNLWLQLRHFSMNLSRILMFLLLGIVYSERGSPSLLGNTAVTRWKQTPRQFKVWQAHSGEGMFLSFVPWQLFCGFFSSM